MPAYWRLVFRFRSIQLPETEDWRAAGFGVYAHWPFCLAKCPYCDFNSHVRREVDHDRWRAALPRPLTPSVLQGRPLNRTARQRAGLDAAFLDRLATEPPATKRSPA